MEAAGRHVRDTERVMHADRMREAREERALATLLGAPFHARRSGQRQPNANGPWARLTAKANTVGFLSPGGVFCGCHTPGCEECMSSGGCGWLGCSPCTDFGYIQQMVMRAERERAAVGFGGVLDGVKQRNVRTSSSASAQIYDFHAHNMGVTNADYADWFAGVPSTTEEQIDRILAMQSASPGVTRSMLSSQENGLVASDKVDESFFLNATTYLAMVRNPDAFDGFVQILPRDFNNPRANLPFAVDWWYAFGFSGVGELFIHGHHQDYNDDVTLPGDRLVDVCRTAAQNGMPVLCHWEFGRVDGDQEDDGSSRTADENFQQLKDLLDQFAAPSEPGDLPLRLVVAHCGLGPADPSLPAEYGGMSDTERVAWSDKITELLDNYPFVYFDLAGLQVGDGYSETKKVKRLIANSALELTQIGSSILAAMVAHPSRFLLGTDCDDEFATTTTATNPSSGATDEYLGMDAFEASIANYIDFLDLTEDWADEADKEKIRTTNAEILLNSWPAWPVEGSDAS